MVVGSNPTCTSTVAQWLEHDKYAPCLTMEPLMSSHYQAFIRWLATRDVPEETFLSALTRHGTSIEAFTSKLETNLTCALHGVYFLHKDFFRFTGSAKGFEYWARVFHPYGHIHVADLLAPYYGEPLSNEQVLAMFFKHHRKFGYLKNYLTPTTVVIVALDQIRTILPVSLCHLIPKWEALCTQFKLTGHINIPKLRAIR